MKKGVSIILTFIIVLSVVFNFLLTQTDVFSKVFGTKLNQTEVMVATKEIENGEEITENNVEMKYILTDYIVKNPHNAKDTNYVIKSLKSLEDGLVATTKIAPGEQISKNKVEARLDAKNPKKLMYAIAVDYLSTVGNSLYVGDRPILWHSYTMGENKDTEKITEKVFNVPVEILALKDGDGQIINVNRNQPAVIPSVAVIKVDEADVIKLEECMGMSSNKFFFVKQLSNN